VNIFALSTDCSIIYTTAVRNKLTQTNLPELDAELLAPQCFLQSSELIKTAVDDVFVFRRSSIIDVAEPVDFQSIYCDARVTLSGLRRMQCAAYCGVGSCAAIPNGYCVYCMCTAKLSTPFILFYRYYPRLVIWSMEAMRCGALIS